MAISLAEFLGQAWLRAGSQGFPVPQEPAANVYSLSSAGSTTAMSTIAFVGNLVAITVTGVNAFALFGSSTLTSTGVSSTNAQLFLPGFVHLRGVRPGMKFIGWSS